MATSAAYLANLQARRTAIASELAALSASAAGGKPNTDGDGVNIDHVGYKDGLYRELEMLDDLIQKAEDDIAADAGNVGIVESQEY